MTQITFEDVEYTLTQEAFIDADYHLNYERVVYKAAAVDSEGNEYLVTWLPVEGYEEMEDESDRCNWEEPEMVEAI